MSFLDIKYRFEYPVINLTVQRGRGGGCGLLSFLALCRASLFSHFCIWSPDRGE